MNIRVDGDMELDSQDAIVRMVNNGLGAAVVPFPEAELISNFNLTHVPFGDPQKFRRVVLLEREESSTGRLAKALVEAVRTSHAMR